MPREDLSSDHSHQGVPQEGGVELSFDELAKGLASGTLSRGKAIRWMGSALLGAALASVPGVAWANAGPTIAGVWEGNVGGTPSAALGTALGGETTRFAAAPRARIAAEIGA
jgi:hypothetical protein